MQFHARSLADPSLGNCQVQFIGHPGTALPEDIQANSNIQVHYVEPFPLILPRKLKLLFPFYAGLKVLWGIAQLFVVLLWRIPRPMFLLVQVPPSIPVLLVAHVTSIFNGCRLVVDWHNFGYTILAMNLGERHILVRISKVYERIFSKGVYASFCVTDAMRTYLRDSWGVTATTLHDHPPSHFKRLDVEETHSLFKSLESQGLLKGAEDWARPNGTLLTQSIGRGVSWREDRPALVVSSTSWTEDEDFSVLLRAIVSLDAHEATPRMLFCITGKGEQRAHYEAEIAKLTLRKTKILTFWVKTEEYCLVLGAANLGVSLHTSSSGLDLPMKVVDMFGCGLPVAARGFSCLHELVEDGKNGLVFANSDELSNILVKVFKGFPKDTTLLDSLAEGAAKKFGPGNKWSDNWRAVALPVFQSQ